MTPEELIDTLHELQEQLEEQHDPALDGAILDIADAIESLENAVLAEIANALAANEAELDAGIAALKSDLKTLGNVATILDDVTKITKVVAKLV